MYYRGFFAIQHINLLTYLVDQASTKLYFLKLSLLLVPFKI